MAEYQVERRQILSDPANKAVVERLRRAGYADADIATTLETQAQKKTPGGAPKGVLGPGMSTTTAGPVPLPGMGDFPGWVPEIPGFTQPGPEAAAPYTGGATPEEMIRAFAGEQAPPATLQDMIQAYMPPGSTGTVPETVAQPPLMAPEAAGTLAPQAPAAAGLAQPPAFPSGPMPGPAAGPMPGPAARAPAAPPMTGGIMPGGSPDYMKQAQEAMARMGLPAPAAGPANDILSKMFSVQPNMAEFGARLLAGSEPRAGQRVGPTFGGAVGEAALGTMGSMRGQSAAAAKSRQEYAKMQLDQARHLEKMAVERYKAQMSNDLKTMLAKVEQGNKATDRKIEFMKLSARAYERIGQIRKDYSDRRGDVLTQVYTDPSVPNEQKDAAIAQRTNALAIEEEEAVNRELAAAGEPPITQSKAKATRAPVQATQTLNGVAYEKRGGQWFKAP